MLLHMLPPTANAPQPQIPRCRSLGFLRRGKIIITCAIALAVHPAVNAPISFTRFLRSKKKNNGCYSAGGLCKPLLPGRLFRDLKPISPPVGSQAQL